MQRDKFLTAEQTVELCYLTKEQESIARLTDLVCEVCGDALSIERGYQTEKVFLHCGQHGVLHWYDSTFAK